MTDSRFSVGANWDLELIDSIKQYPVSLLYAKLEDDIIGGGRPNYLLPKISKEQASEFIKYAKQSGIGFNYLLNTSCLGNEEFTSTFNKGLMQILEWIDTNEVEYVTVAIPYIVEIVKKYFPHIKVNVSVLAHVNSIQRAKYFENLGADTITISDSHNRDFRFLKNLVKGTKCQIQLIPNLTCLKDCPYQFYHANQVSHASNSQDEMDGYYLDYCIIKCTQSRVNSPIEFIKSGWIRPEDITEYEKIGINSFKLVERFDTTQTITNAVKAYSERTYKGNLADILNVKTDPKKQTNVNPEPLIRPEFCNIKHMQDIEDTIYIKEVIIDNNKLDGFLDFFKTKNCRVSSCEQCGYCNKIATEVVYIPDAKNAREKLDNKVESIVSGEVFNFEYTVNHEDELTLDIDAQELYDYLAEDIPAEFRGVAENTIKSEILKLTKLRNSNVSNQNDVKEAFISSTPDSFKSNLLKQLDNFNKSK
jgi:collagenase-like PrtC family protease